MSDNTIAIGRLLKPFGVEGLLRFESYSGMTEHLSEIDELMLHNTRSGGSDAVRIHKIEAWYTNSPLRCKLAGVETPEDARTFTGMEAYVDRSLANRLGAEEYYLADLQGLSVRFEGKTRGTIEAVYTDAYAPLFEIRWMNNKKSIIPFIKEFFGLPEMGEESSLGSIEIMRGELVEDED